MATSPFAPNGVRQRRAATLGGELPAFDEQASIPTLEVPIYLAAPTEEVVIDDILEATPIAPSVAMSFATGSLPPPGAPPRRSTRVAAAEEGARSIAPWVLGGVAIGLVVSLGIAVVVRVVDARTPYPRTHVTVVQASGVQASGVQASGASPAARATSPSPAPPAGPAADDVPTIGVDSLPVAPATRGALRFAPKAHGHRVYLDGVVVGESEGDVDVRCGAHTLRVGSRGEARAVVVPCGGVLDVP